MFPIINVWGFFSDNGSFSLTFSHVLPVSLFKSNSSSASVGTCKFLGLLQSQEKSRGGCGMKQSSGTVLVEFLWWGWKYPPAVEFHQLCHTFHLPICHLLLTFLTCRALCVPSVFLWWKCLWFTTFSSFAALYFTPGSSFSFPAQFPGELRLQENYPGVENGHFCLCAGCGLVPAALTGGLIGQVMLFLLLLHRLAGKLEGPGILGTSFSSIPNLSRI